MATLEGLLASLLNPNPGVQRAGLLGPNAMAQTGLGPEQLARYHQASGLGGGQAMPQAAPPAPSMPQQATQAPDQMQTASTAAPAPAGGGILGGLGDAIGGLFNPKGANKNRTVQLLMQDGLDEGTATLVAQDKGSLNMYLRQRAFGGGAKQSEFAERSAAAQQYGLSGEDAQRFILTGDLPQARGGAAELGLNPQYGVDAKGNPVLIQIGKDGKAVQTALPAGVSLSKEPIKMDAGTHWVLLDPITRQPVGQIEKDLAGAEAEKVAGKGQGEALESWRSMTSKMPGLESVVTQLDTLAEQATYTLAGQAFDYGRGQLGMEPRDAAVARTKYTAMVDNQVLPLLRDTFGAQFTQAEGATLRTTLGDPNKTPAEKQEVLRAFIEQKRRDVEALAARTGQAATSGEAQSFTDQKQVLQAIQDGKLKIGDEIMFNGERMRVDP